MLLAILFGNIIDNAIRYSGAGSSIQISVKPASKGENACNEILISDNGPAIPDSIRDRIFEKFFRAHTERGNQFSIQLPTEIGGVWPREALGAF